MKTTNENKFNLIESINFIDKLADKIFSVNNSFEDLHLIKRHYPAANITQSDTGVSLQLAIPGCDKEDIKISLDKNALTISFQKEENKQVFTKKEFSFSSFSRSFNLSDSLDKNSIKSSLKNGVLTIEISKVNPEIAKVEKRTIPVD